MRRTVQALAGAVALLVTAGTAASAGSPPAQLPNEGAQAPNSPDGDWPSFRGARGDAVSAERGLLRAWPESGPEVLWRRPLGPGFSAVTVAEGRLLTLFGEGENSVLGAFEPLTGRRLWSTRVDDLYRNAQGDGPRSTPAVAHGLAFALSGRGVLAAVRAEDGTLVWRHDLRDEYRASGPDWGFSGSPVVDEDRLLMDVGGRGGLVAFDARSGAELWRSQADRAGYSTPLLAELGGQRQAVFFTGERVVAVAPQDGALLWSLPWSTSFGVNAATPVWVPPDGIFVASGYGVGSALLRVAAGNAGADSGDNRLTVETVWRSREMKNQFSSSLLHDGYLYGFDNAIFQCLDASTGERMWRTRGFGHGSLLYADGHLLVLSDRGSLALVRATPAEYAEVSRFQALSGRSWTMPSLAGGRLYLRSESELAALDLRAPRETE